MNKKLVMLVSAGVLVGGVFADDEEPVVEPVAPTISSASVELNVPRTASTLSATVTVVVGDLGGAESVPITVTATPQINKVEGGEFFDLPVLTGATTASATGSCTVELAGLIPGRKYDLQVVATGVDGAAATNVTESAVSVPGGFGKMCFKPDAGKSAYSWTMQKWYASPTGAEVAYLSSLGDDVFLYSSKNKSVPLSVDSGVHAETKNMTFCDETYLNRQKFRVASGGTITNAGDVIVGNAGGTAECAGDLVVQGNGEWTALRNFFLGNAANAYSTLTIETNGCFRMPSRNPDNIVNGDISALVVANKSSAAGLTNSIVNHGTVQLWDFFLGGNGRAVFDNYGTCTVNRKFTLGRNAGSYGYFRLRKGGRLQKAYKHGKSLILGHMGTGVLELDDDLTLTNNDYVSMGNSNIRSRGELILNGTAVFTSSGQTVLGNFEKSEAALTLNDASRFASTGNFRVANGSNSVARVTLNGESVLEKVKDFIVGLQGGATGVVELCGSSVISNLNSKMIVLGNKTGAYGELVVADSSRVHGLTNLSVGVVSGARGQLRFRGGTIYLPGGGGGVWSLFVGRNGASSQGTVRGWGAFERPKETLRLMPYGQFIADGEGAEHDLDLGWFKTVGNGGGDYPNQCGANGWYAVNKGRLRYPHQQNNSASNYKISGDYPNRAEPTLVNSFEFNLTGRTDNHFLHADLYASDRSDIPAGLDAKQTGKENRIAGVLRAGYFTTNGAQPTAATKSDFSSGTIRWRYDQTGLDAEWTVKIFRHDGTASGSWRQVHKSAFNAGTTTLTTDSFSCSADDWNLGWFAVVATKGSRGTLIIVR